MKPYPNLYNPSLLYNIYFTSEMAVVNWTEHFVFVHCCLNTENYPEYSSRILRIKF